MPDQAQFVDGVVWDLVDAQLRRRRRRRFMEHVEQSQRLPAERLEFTTPRLGGADHIEIDAPVCEVGERLVGNGDEFRDAHRRILLDADEIEVPVVGEAGGAHHGAMRPRFGDVADHGLATVVPLAGANSGVDRCYVGHDARL